MGSTGNAMEPYTPLNLPKPFADEVWIVDGPEIRMDYALLRLPFPTRMVVVRLSSGELWVHSPIAPEERMFRAIGELGAVRYLVAPSSLHCWYMADWIERYPEAETYAVPELDRTAKRSFRIDRVFAEESPPTWAGEIDWQLIEGSVVNEAVFHVRAARVLVLTDLIENFEPWRICNRLLRWLIGVAGADGSTPINLRLTFWAKRRAAAARIEQMIGWPPEKVVMAHGKPIEEHAARELERAFAWARRWAR
jgi:hypothetical protein